MIINNNNNNTNNNVGSETSKNAPYRVLIVKTEEVFLYLLKDSCKFIPRKLKYPDFKHNT